MYPVSLTCPILSPKACAGLWRLKDQACRAGEDGGKEMVGNEQRRDRARASEDREGQRYVGGVG